MGENSSALNVRNSRRDSIKDMMYRGSSSGRGLVLLLLQVGTRQSGRPGQIITSTVA